jgi:type IV fimbrial biogenesis protein FimT
LLGRQETEQLLIMPVRQRGASLIEFMIAFVVLGILVGLSIPSFRDWIVNSQVRTASDAIKDGVQLARTEAVRRNSPVRWRLPVATEAGWVIEALDRSTTTWGQVQLRSAQESTSSTVVAASQTTIVFAGSGVVVPAPTQAITVDVSNPPGGACVAQNGSGQVRCLRIVVTGGGQIRMCDPATPSTSPTAC